MSKGPKTHYEQIPVKVVRKIAAIHFVDEEIHADGAHGRRSSQPERHTQELSAQRRPARRR
jgi:hypothetical protein